MNSFEALFLDPHPPAPEPVQENRPIETGTLDWPARLKAQEIRNAADEMVSRGEAPTLGKIVAMLERREISVSAVDVASVLGQMGVTPAPRKTGIRAQRNNPQPEGFLDASLMLDDLLAVKAFVDQVGGFERAEFLIDLLRQLA